jgi:altronate hydrolase
MNRGILRVHPEDDMIVALRDHRQGELIELGGAQLRLLEPVPAKHKFVSRDLAQGELLRMYGIIVGRATRPIRAGQLVSTGNLVHATDSVIAPVARHDWSAPDISAWSGRTFHGFIREDGRVGIRNYWIVVPLVFCENRNVTVMSEALVSELGYGRDSSYRTWARQLVQSWSEGADQSTIRQTCLEMPLADTRQRRIFANVDGIKCLRHTGGCGGTNADAENLCGLLAGYINHPNVAGATVLSLGCQKSQVQMLQAQLHLRNPNLHKPVYIFEQQRTGSEQTLLSEAMKHTFAGLISANQQQRQPAPLRQLVLGVECGGSDGFSGISANPAMGHCSDLLVALGGAVILSEFPELAGCEQDLMSRCVTPELAERFLRMMRDYERLANAVGAGFADNPSPGNVRDGLITDAMKSAGAARKGGTSPVVDVLDYPQPVTRHGLNLLCTPGGDIESTTALAGSGAMIQLFSTGLGTPTGNPVSPVLKISTNSDLARRMPDIIDLDAGGIVTGDATIAQIGARMLDLVIDTASGTYITKAEALGQDDFIPWKRGVSL